MKIRRLFEKYDIHSIRIAADSDIRASEASRVEIRFNSGGDRSAAYGVTFKLLGPGAGAHRYLRGIGPGSAPELTDEGRALGTEGIEPTLNELVGAIGNRIAKIHKEQSILNIQPVGKTFTLSGKTRFDVIADDGDGRLRIRIHAAEGDKDAALSANDLLDGLYTGLIERD